MNSSDRIDTEPIDSTPSTESDLVSVGKRSNSYIARHWNGELPLYVSFWINGVLLNYAGYYGTVGLQGAVDIPEHPRMFALLIVMMWVLSVAVTVWQLTGIWHSAKAKVARTGKRFWPRAAQTLVLLSCVQMMFLYFGAVLPAAIDLGKVALGSDRNGDWTVTALPARAEVEISGGIGFGLTRQVREQLDAHPGIAVVRLESGGGRGLEATRMRELITARGLSTRVTTHCESACTIIFMAGKTRELSKAGKLGFHAPWSEGMSLGDPQQSMRNDKEAFITSGINTAFLDKAFSTPSNEMWYPSIDELVQAKVVTRVE